VSQKLPRITASEITKVLEERGFTFYRQSGSHKIYKNKEDKRVTVPYHSGKILHSKLLKTILRNADVSTRELRDLL